MVYDFTPKLFTQKLAMSGIKDMPVEFNRRKKPHKTHDMKDFFDDEDGDESDEAFI